MDGRVNCSEQHRASRWRQVCHHTDSECHYQWQSDYDRRLQLNWMSNVSHQLRFSKLQPVQLFFLLSNILFIPILLVHACAQLTALSYARGTVRHAWPFYRWERRCSKLQAMRRLIRVNQGSYLTFDWSLLQIKYGVLNQNTKSKRAFNHVYAMRPRRTQSIRWFHYSFVNLIMARLHLHRQRSVLLRPRGVLTIYRKQDCLIHQSAPQKTKNRCII